MKTARTIVIGDVHGCLEELMTLVERIRLQDGDTLVLAGDLLDKGPDPLGCIRFAKAIGAQMVLGNHEEKALRWLRHEGRRVKELSYRNPMTPPDAASAEVYGALSEEEVKWLASRPVTLQVGDWVIVHAGLLPCVPIALQLESAKHHSRMMRIRWVDEAGDYLPIDPASLDRPLGARHWAEAYDGPFHVAYGHMAASLDAPRVDRTASGRECWGLDTGCVYGGKLSALVLETRELIQVSAGRRYSDPVGAHRSYEGKGSAEIPLLKSHSP